MVNRINLRFFWYAKSCYDCNNAIKCVVHQQWHHNKASNNTDNKAQVCTVRLNEDTEWEVGKLRVSHCDIHLHNNSAWKQLLHYKKETKQKHVCKINTNDLIKNKWMRQWQGYFKHFGGAELFWEVAFRCFELYFIKEKEKQENQHQTNSEYVTQSKWS